jgi:hypothetical protein
MASPNAKRCFCWKTGYWMIVSRLARHGPPFYNWQLTCHSADLA